VDNTRGTRVGQVVSSFRKVLRGSLLTWYTGYYDIKDIKGMREGYQEEIEISMKYLTDFSEILKNICRIYLI